MDVTTPAITRREGLAKCCHWALSAAVLYRVMQPRTAAAAKADKKDFFYQDKPKAGKSCSSCRMFSPSANGKGQCAIVDGDVLPSGWCMAYSPRE